MAPETLSVFLSFGFDLSSKVQSIPLTTAFCFHQIRMGRTRIFLTQFLTHFFLFLCFDETYLSFQIFRITHYLSQQLKNNFELVFVINRNLGKLI